MTKVWTRVAAALSLCAVASCSGSPALVRRPADPPKAVLIEDVSVLDVESGYSTPNRDVLVKDGRIVQIADTGESQLPAGGQRINGRGATLLPGLIDMHTHPAAPAAPPWMASSPDEDANLQAFLYSGVTTILGTGDLAPDAFERRDRINRGEQLGPSNYEAGPIVTATGGHPVALFSQSLPWFLRWYVIPRMARQVDTPEQARVAAAEIASMNADVLKVVVDRLPPAAPRISNDTLAAAIEEARKHDLRAVAHIGTAQDASDAAEAGVAAWIHGVYKERLSDHQIEELANFGIPMAPTLVVFETFASFGEPFEATPLEQETVDPEILAAMNEVPDYFKSFTNNRSERIAFGRENVRRLHQAGVTILAGSDAQGAVFAGASLHREIGLLVEAGLTPAEAIRAATIAPARFLSRSKTPDFGLIREGARADLLLVEGDPTEDIANLARIRTVLKDGVPLERTPRSRN